MLYGQGTLIASRLLRFECVADSKIIEKALSESNLGFHTKDLLQSRPNELM